LEYFYVEPDGGHGFDSCTMCENGEEGCFPAGVL